ncbi:MAG: hypothetical protein CMP11_06240 [Zetaproteobacteria bacterium]|nr:hypothetical protein [Pseudobdellovibrionaceae bacterium]
MVLEGFKFRGCVAVVFLCECCKSFNLPAQKSPRLRARRFASLKKGLGDNFVFYKSLTNKAYL